jgi:glycosyltransferase involved in cell wall biosynthesis
LIRVGWATAATLRAERATFRGLETSVAMRIANTARWIDRRGDGVRNEMYRPGRPYDVVVFCKAMDELCQAEAARLQAAGTRVVFDANVNYYEVWGEYDLPATEPTPQQQVDAVAMTRAADAVVADSTYILDLVTKLNPNATWIPDNVDTRLFKPGRARGGDRVRLVWSGRAQKAKPLLELREPLAGAGPVELVVVSDREPDVLPALREVVDVTYEPFSLRGYARVLRSCDVIASPKRLVNAYELGHTEWKITLGMAAALPAVASPQRSYVEAISDRGGGIVADTPDEWRDALRRLAEDGELRRDVGARARETVEERYSTPVVARRYLDLLRSLV